MPKIIIREYDKSTAATTANTSFAVVVPGGVTQGIRQVATSTTAALNYGEDDDGNSVFDDNGIYECSSQTDFKKYIGKLTTVVNPIAPIEADLTEAGLTLTFSIFVAGTDKTLTEEQEAHNAKSEGYFAQLLGSVATYDGLGVYTATAKEYTEVGKLHTKTTFYTKTTEIAYPEATEDTEEYTTTYTILTYEGNDTTYHRGNQIAYELLGMGYTVLYKKLSTYTDLATADFWEPLKDKSIYDFRYITTGGVSAVEAVNKIIAVAEFNNNVTLYDAETVADSNGRGDCIALVDIDESNITPSSMTPVQILAGLNTAMNNISASKYAAIFAPEVTYSMEADEGYSKNKTFPASFHYLAAAANAFQNYAEWYAIANSARGVAARTISGVSIKLGERAVNTLAPRKQMTFSTIGAVTKAANFVITDHGSYYLYGNRTALTLREDDLVYSHFLNVRQLCCTIKKQLRTTCRRYQFDPNSDTLWINVLAGITPTLDRAQGDQGIDGYQFTRVLDSTKGLVKTVLRIVPIEAVEDFDMSIYLEDSISGTDVTAAEEDEE